jgi:uncharacterized protein YbjT (DUF2867 family)
MTSSPVLVTGATGKQGGVTARRLLAEGIAVRALVRDPAAPAATRLAAAGARLVRGDFDDPASLTAALDGVAAVFGVPPVAFGPGGADIELEVARGRALIDAAATAGIERIVFSTVATSSTVWSGFQGKARIEQYLLDRIARPTILRPVRFMTNYLSNGAAGIEGIVDGLHRHIFPGDQPVQVIALEDIAEFATMAFTQPDRFAGRILELAGDQPTPVEAAKAITEATGIQVRYQELTDAEAAAMGPHITEIRDGWREGNRWHADIEALRVIHPGLRTFRDWLEESGAEKLSALL